MGKVSHETLAFYTTICFFEFVFLGVFPIEHYNPL